jgi:hypothetical protein
MCQPAQHGIAVMREFHSNEGLDRGTTQMLESLGEAAAKTLTAKEWNEESAKTLLMVILRSACQIGRHAIA